MHPHLFQLGPLTIYTYGVALVLGFLLALGLARRAVQAQPPSNRAIEPDQLTDLCCAALLGGIVGGRLLYVILQWDVYRATPLEVFAIWHGGLIWYGGLLGGAAAAWGYLRAQRLAFLRVGDQCVPYLALGHAVGRFGCFLNGCCYGRPTTAWCGVRFPGQDVSVLPTQLFETGGLLVLWLALRRLHRPEILRQPGRVCGVYLAGYAGLRFVLEFLRGDQPMAWAGLTLQQIISLAIGAVGMWWVLRRL